VPSPVDWSLVLPQFVVMGVVGAMVAYYQFIMVPSADVKFRMKTDKDFRVAMKGAKAGDGGKTQQVGCSPHPSQSNC